jgi:hypothetical protein
MRRITTHLDLREAENIFEFLIKFPNISTFGIFFALPYIPITFHHKYNGIVAETHAEKKFQSLKCFNVAHV